ncbi:hypothetical protein SLOPH_915 [Spraguea lophii 42_110]|uniref:Uncharacterized protein n=1 Tax=Spraguea lophii (strain 42_110) TaxID=1358809 RepID=S7WE37_SPRLO|nr:hypothetical protein SLOPH_915 [Spraguea lophii 42_110]
MVTYFFHCNIFIILIAYNVNIKMLEMYSPYDTSGNIPSGFLALDEKNKMNQINNIQPLNILKHKFKKNIVKEVSDSTMEDIKRERKQKNRNEYEENKEEVKDDKILSETKNIQKAKDDIDRMEKYIQNELNLPNVKSIVDKKIWEGLLNYLKNNFADFLDKNGNLSIPITIKYMFCFYIVAFMPSQFVFFFPSSIMKLIPKKSYEVPILKDFVTEFKSFLLFVKEDNKESFLTTLVIGRKRPLLEDLKFLIHIPVKIFSEPLSLIRDCMGFKFFAKGYDEYKEKQKNK